VPFLFVVAMFFGNLVQEARRRERETTETQAREQRMVFLSGLSHDLKNPLGVVQSLAMLLLEGDAGPLNEEQADLVHRIHASIRHVITFAFNIIDAARIETGHLVLNRRTVSVKDLVEDAVLLARSAGQLKGVALHSVIEPGVPPAEIDAVQIERVISNVVGNAIKFTPPGGIVTIALRQDADAIALSVSDNGPGIPAAELPTVFEQYRRNANNGRVDGSGLGLFIVKAIVEAHGGSVGIESSLGRGTTVLVQLPIAHLHSSASPGAASPTHRRWWHARGRLPIAPNRDTAAAEAKL
jgi:signal transduction histidine kinase